MIRVCGCVSLYNKLSACVGMFGTSTHKKQFYRPSVWGVVHRISLQQDHATYIGYVVNDVVDVKGK